MKKRNAAVRVSQRRRGRAIEPKEGYWSRLETLIRDDICGGNREYAEYIIHWMAHGVQKPDAQGIPPIIFRHSADDDGKAARILGNSYGSLFGDRYCYATNAEAVTETAFFVFLDGVGDVETIDALLAGHPTRRIMASTWVRGPWTVKL
ncbi:MAG: hypothetical protein L0Z50_31015 [Verrucomicrobiales bacterium]|nr:hypothetical protein [Verrucomicrobiales bacterium]